MANATLKVSISELKTQAQGIEDEIASIETNWESLSTVVENSTTYWVGEASDQYRKIFTDQKEAMEALLKKLNEHPKDLREIAGTYKKAEKAAKKLANALPKNVII